MKQKRTSAESRIQRSRRLPIIHYVVDVLIWALALPLTTSLRSYSGPVQPGDLYVANAGTNWTVQVDGQTQARLPGDGWAQTFQIDQAGTATLTHNNVSSYWYASLAQSAAWLVLIAALVLSRRRRS